MINVVIYLILEPLCSRIYSISMRHLYIAMHADRKTHTCMYVYMYMCLYVFLCMCIESKTISSKVYVAKVQVVKI